jgi:RNA polymerase sigma-70 factor (ECF subfamily)
MTAMSSDSAGSLELLARIQGGDQEAWNDLYLRYRDRLLFTIRCRLGPALRARLQSEDILHSVVRQALSDLERFRPHDDGALGRFLHVCVLNKIRQKGNFFGAQRRTGDVPMSDSLLARLPEGGPDRYLDHERYDALERALHLLPDALREVVLLRTVQGCSNQEAARVLGKSPEATSKADQRAVARMAVAVGRRS